MTTTANEGDGETKEVNGNGILEERCRDRDWIPEVNRTVNKAIMSSTPCRPKEKLPLVYTLAWPATLLLQTM